MASLAKLGFGHAGHKCITLAHVCVDGDYYANQLVKAFFDAVNAGLAVRIQFRLSRALKLSAILKMPYFAFFCFCWPMRTLKCKTLAS